MTLSFSLAVAELALEGVGLSPLAPSGLAAPLSEPDAAPTPPKSRPSPLLRRLTLLCEAGAGASLLGEGGAWISAGGLGGAAPAGSEAASGRGCCCSGCEGARDVAWGTAGAGAIAFEGKVVLVGDAERGSGTSCGWSSLREAVRGGTDASVEGGTGVLVTVEGGVVKGVEEVEEEGGSRDATRAGGPGRVGCGTARGTAASLGGCAETGGARASGMVAAGGGSADANAATDGSSLGLGCGLLFCPCPCPCPCPGACPCAPPGLVPPLLLGLPLDRGRCPCCCCAAARSWSVETPMARRVDSLGRFGLGGSGGTSCPPLTPGPAPAPAPPGLRRGLLCPLKARAAASETPLELLLVGSAGSAVAPSARPCERVRPPSLVERNHPRLLRPPRLALVVPLTPAALMTLGGLPLSTLRRWPRLLRLKAPKPPPRVDVVEMSDEVLLLAGAFASYRDSLPLAAALARSFSRARCALSVRWYTFELR